MVAISRSWLQSSRPSPESTASLPDEAKLSRALRRRVDDRLRKRPLRGSGWTPGPAEAPDAGHDPLQVRVHFRFRCRNHHHRLLPRDSRTSSLSRKPTTAKIPTVEQLQILEAVSVRFVDAIVGVHVVVVVAAVANVVVVVETPNLLPKKQLFLLHPSNQWISEKWKKTESFKIPVFKRQSKWAAIYNQKTFFVSFWYFRKLYLLRCVPLVYYLIIVQVMLSLLFLILYLIVWHRFFFQPSRVCISSINRF